MESQKKQLGTGTGILTNCKECLADRHDSCLNNGCLCAIETNHNSATLKNGVRVDDSKPINIESLIEIFSVENNLKFDGHDRIDNVAKALIKFHNFVTLRNTDKILLYNEKIYDSRNAESKIKELTEKLIPNCTKLLNSLILIPIQPELKILVF